MSRTVRVSIVIGLIVAMAAALAVVLVQDSGNSDVPAAAPTASASPTTEPTADTSASPAASAEPVAVPTPDLTGDDYERIFREVMRFRDWLFEHPDPSYVDLIFAENCDCYEPLVNALRDLNETGRRFDDDGFRVLSVELRQDLGETVRLVAEIERTPQRLVNEDGNVVEESAGVPPRSVSVSLVQSGSNGWRVASIVELSQE